MTESKVPDSLASEPPPRPRWVKVLVLGVVLFVVVLTVLKLLGVDHGGPNRHGSAEPLSGSSSGQPGGR